MHLLKIKKASAILFSERKLITKAHTETFIANNTKKGRMLQQDQKKLAGASYPKAFGRVYSLELAIAQQAQAQAKAEQAAKKTAEKEALALHKRMERLQQNLQTVHNRTFRDQETLHKKFVKEQEARFQQLMKEHRARQKKKEQERTRLAKKEEQDRKKLVKEEQKRNKMLKNSQSTQKRGVEQEVSGPEWEGLCTQMQIDPSMSQWPREGSP